MRRTLLTIAAILFLHTTASLAATVESNCFEVVAGTLPHVRHKTNTPINFAIDKYGSEGWKVTVHHERGWGYVETGVVGKYVNNNMFSNDLYSVTGEGETFTFAFRWYYNGGTSPWNQYGWMTLGTENGDLTIIASRFTDEENVVVVGDGTPTEVVRDPPILDVYVPRGKTLDDDTKSALMRTTAGLDYSTAKYLHLDGEHPGEYSEDGEPATAPVACAHLGITPCRIETFDAKGEHMGVFYVMPTVVMTGFDPVTRTITGRVVPAAGTRIVSEPLKRAFGFKHYVSYPDGDGNLIEGNDWGPWINAGDQGFEIDFSDYLTDGTFRITYPDYVPEDKYTNLFRFLLHDNAAQLW